MATLPFPVIPLMDGDRGIYHSDNHDSLLFGNAPPALEGSGAGPSAPTFTRLVREIAERTQAVSLPQLTEALVTDMLTLLEARGLLADAFQTVELMRSYLEMPLEMFREIARMLFTSLRALPGAADDIQVPQLASQIRRLSPRLDLRAGASAEERRFPLVTMDLMEYVTNPTKPTPETPLGSTAVDLTGSPEGSVATVFGGVDAQGRALPHVTSETGGQVRMPAVHPSQIQRIFPAHFGERRTISEGYLHSCSMM